jgi:hypothetical protein
VEGINCALILGIMLRFPEGTEENSENIIQDIRCPSQYSNKAPTKCKSEVLLPEPYCLVRKVLPHATLYQNLFTIKMKANKLNLIASRHH